MGVGEQPPHFPTLLRTGAPGGENRLVPSSLSGRWRGFKDGRGTQRGSRRRHGNSQPKRENRTMWPRTSRGARSVSAASYSPAGTRDQRKLPDRSPAPRDTVRPCHANLPVHVRREQNAFGPGEGAPARPPTSSPSKTRAGWPNPAAWSGVIAERKLTPQTVTQEPGRRATSTPPWKTLSARSEVTRMDGRGVMLVDPSEQPHQPPIAAPGRLPKHC